MFSISRCDYLNDTNELEIQDRIFLDLILAVAIVINHYQDMIFAGAQQYAGLAHTRIGI